ncbi:Uncharacterized protein, contains SIS (Sugar ISomerase) phosphosugar binding domain [Anaerobranca californiensis DSM 14826]|jgi:uncharacterized phosphosugar-binding protein|uniref:Uncharacterized protein, contains SIS (Sugar ISomerase) phosphosugar binding domain n=1 Tax=Anaerobranca californiensis DSM 14826 TaxID=1120989 RepID=A0A1M6R9S6_9FIRM|nr:SIS domain-containing protein [Anaerobranca californiensis]SHK29239.1 Uncharacterized protein, contains SIS (Sugar ISomerase) phosphosugar binding domain [Anaerobranca californiensis DSM 14826]
MLKYTKTYFYKIAEILEKVQETQGEKIYKAGLKIAETFEKGKSTFVFGCSHAGIIAEELFYRTGGLAIINPIFNPTLMLNTRPVTLTTQMERINGFGKVILESSPIQKGDVLIIHSVSGRNSVPVEMAIEAKGKGIYVIAITNLTYSKNVSSRDKSNKKLYEVADLVIDNCGVYEDSVVEMQGLSQKVGPTSTIIGAVIGHSIVIETVSILLEKGITPPIFHSANVDGGDEFNQEILNKYQGLIHYL